MKIDFTPYFEKYKTIVTQADELFARVQKDHQECVTCKIKCADCCHALFDLTLIEAIYINHQFNKTIKGKGKIRLIDRANRADRKTHMVKKQAYKNKKAGKNETEILMDIAAERVRCPLLNDNDMCDLYEYRPITCRLYGIPTSIGGRSHTCGKSGFIEGKQYPAVNLDAIQKKLYDISSEFVREIKTKYLKMADMLVPLSMAILTDFDEEYLGIAISKKAKEERGRENEQNLT
ncbi:MAG: YkgJ family cysteine cluster protein [Thermodesulfobacteriota bacterium]|nr:YkgJ family cysteine cluster protein [Thermodesulfobacteriota bacterium]